MKVILAAVVSLDGKTTKHKNQHVASWTSEEDKSLFAALIKKQKLIVMGSKTYEAARRDITLQKGTLRIVMTHQPGKYRKAHMPGVLEFTNETPQALIRRLTKQYHTMLLVGGSEINVLFLKAKLVNELYLTIEPLLFGTGKQLVASTSLRIRCKLIRLKKLNRQGTVFAHYRII